MVHRRLGTRINQRIQEPEVHLVDSAGQSLGVVSIDAARAQARSAGLDLVEMVPAESPPVCRILDYGRYRRRPEKHRSLALKVVNLRATDMGRTLDGKIARVRRFLEEGKRVKLTQRCRGRRTASPVPAERIEQVLTAVHDVGEITQRHALGRTFTCVLIPIGPIKKMPNEHALPAKPTSAEVAAVAATLDQKNWAIELAMAEAAARSDR